MISMNVPGIVKLLQSVMINMIFMDLFLTDQWQPEIFYGSNFADIDSEPLNDFILENGYASTFLFKNLGSTIVFFELYVAAWAVILVLYSFRSYD
jgi:hypothetical protein